MNRVSDFLVIRFHAGFTREVEGAGETQLALEKMAQSPGIGFGRHNAKTGGAKEILRH